MTTINLLIKESKKKDSNAHHYEGLLGAGVTLGSGYYTLKKDKESSQLTKKKYNLLRNKGAKAMEAIYNDTKPNTSDLNKKIEVVKDNIKETNLKRNLGATALLVGGGLLFDSNRRSREQLYKTSSKKNKKTHPSYLEGASGIGSIIGGGYYAHSKNKELPALEADKEKYIRFLGSVDRGFELLEESGETKTSFNKKELASISRNTKSALKETNKKISDAIKGRRLGAVGAILGGGLVYDSLMNPSKKDSYYN